MDEKLYSYLVILFAAAAFFYCGIMFLCQVSRVRKLKKKYPSDGEMGKYIKKQTLKCLWLFVAEVVLAAAAVYFKVKF